MKRITLERLKQLLVGLREPAPAEESERRAVAAFKRELDWKAGRPEDRGRPILDAIDAAGEA